MKEQLLLGNRLYRESIVKSLEIVIDKVKPQRVMDLGVGLIATVVRLADKFKNVKFYGVDKDESVISKLREFNKFDSIEFICCDMERLSDEIVRECDIIFMLHSFHHIQDPDKNKENFLEHMYSKMREGSYLWIGETFLPDEKTVVKDLWKARLEDEYAYAFWNKLNNEEDLNVREAVEEAIYTKDNLEKCINKIIRRQDEYLISREWLVNTSSTIGFNIEINAPINSLGSGVVLLKR